MNERATFETRLSPMESKMERVSHFFTLGIDFQCGVQLGTTWDTVLPPRVSSWSLPGRTFPGKERGARHFHGGNIPNFRDTGKRNVRTHALPGSVLGALPWDYPQTAPWGSPRSVLGDYPRRAPRERPSASPRSVPGSEGGAMGGKALLGAPGVTWGLKFAFGLFAFRETRPFLIPNRIPRRLPKGPLLPRFSQGLQGLGNSPRGELVSRNFFRPLVHIG